jgi:hypothetical protein
VIHKTAFPEMSALQREGVPAAYRLFGVAGRQPDTAGDAVIGGVTTR